ncbi:glycosyl transferase, family 2 [Pedobacter sp. BAL39]|uniref:glycosyltransferase family 2 protein n=1 Tax=Pedobacter sp. BAL39 TaxID=391596 RepID=UPI00015596EE|nr:glycosyltransferase family 2 protein [Pedobacter sp. BAL39]EDM37555.1 glycosyl transferase, family 2 [Pedobacter sp. BAL39]
MHKTPTISLIISTYNWPEALELALLSVKAQSIMPTELIIADDGSDSRTKHMVDKYRAKISIPIKHVWHEDEGFRLAKIRNMAISRASGEYIVQVDGDIIMHTHFIEDHMNFALPGSFVRASRVYINKETSKKMIQHRLHRASAFSPGISNFFSALRVPFLWRYFENTYKSKGNERYEIHGCNMAYWRKDAIKVNGYNELFNGWGPEDKEFVARLLNIGLQKRFIKLGAIAFHLYHKESSKKFLKTNVNAFRKSIEQKLIYCELGINQYI